MTACLHTDAELRFDATQSENLNNLEVLVSGGGEHTIQLGTSPVKTKLA